MIRCRQRYTDTQITKPVTPKPREPDVQRFTPQRPSADVDQDRLERPSSSPTRQAAPTDDKPLPAKQLKKRSREPSEAFTSAPSSPGKDPGPSPQTRPAPSPPVFTYPRAPPRFVNSFDGQVLVDRMGRIPRAFPLENAVEEEEVEVEVDEEKDEEIAENKVQWPPLRRHAAAQKKASEPDVGIDKHHAFSQPQATLPLEEDADGERPLFDRRAVVTQFIADVRSERKRDEDVVQNCASPVNRTASSAPEPHASPAPKSPSPPEEDEDSKRRHPFELDTHDVVAQIIGDVPVESKHREEAVNGTSPVKRTVPPPELRPGPAPKLSKAPKYAAPRPSTASPFGPESPTKGARPPKPQSRLPRIKAARHPAVTRIQREGKDGREEVHAPSVDFVAPSRSSASAQSSRSSRTSVRHPRWSLPTFPRVPWVDEHGVPSTMGSGSGVALPFRLRPPVYGEWDHDRRASTAFTPSPARSLTTDGTLRSPALARVALHPKEVGLVCSHGLASFLTHMAANHGLALSVVEEVYGRLGSLAAADEVLKGMREAAQEFGEREIERRLRVGVEVDEDEYSPPETSRAAMWKRREMQRAEEERAVEDDLVEEQHDFSRVALDEQDEAEAATAEALVEHLPAQALQRRMGYAQFRKEIVKRFV